MILPKNKLENELADQGLPEGEISKVSPIASATQNINLRLFKGDKEFVLRRPS